MRAMMLVLTALTAVFSGPAPAQTASLDPTPRRTVFIPQITLTHPAGGDPETGDPDAWVTDHSGPNGEVRGIAPDLNGDGVRDMAVPVVTHARDRYGVRVWFGPFVKGVAVNQRSALVFEDRMTPRTFVELSQQGSYLGVRRWRSGPMELFYWTGTAFKSLTAPPLLSDIEDFPDLVLDAGYAYPEGWRPLPMAPDAGSLRLRLDDDSPWDSVEVVANASQSRYGVVVWRAANMRGGAYRDPVLLFDRPLTPATHIKLIPSARAFIVQADGGEPELYGWDGKAIVLVKK